MRAGRDQVRMQDRLDDVLEPGALAHELVASGDLSAQRLRRLVGNPDLGQEAAGVKLREHPSVDGVGLDLRVRDDPHLLGVGDHDPLHIRADYRSDGRGVAGRLHDDHVLLRQRGRERAQPVAAHVNAPESFELAVLQHHRLGKGAVDVQSDNVHATPFERCSSKREPAGNTTATDPRSRRIRASRKGGHVTSSGSQPSVC
jgi:hypothetical protein